MAEERLVKAFNDLPNPKVVPSGLPNHWHFSVRHVPFEPPGDVVHLVHVESGFISTIESPEVLEILPLDPRGQADVVVPLLLNGFLKGVHKKQDGAADKDRPDFAPWQWSTNDVELAKSMETKLKAVGVRKELCTVDVGNETENGIATESWFELLNSMAKMVASCGGCKKPGSTVTNGLQRCSRCRSAWYCSTACQKADWKAHKKDCKT